MRQELHQNVASRKILHPVHAGRDREGDSVEMATPVSHNPVTESDAEERNNRNPSNPFDGRNPYPNGPPGAPVVCLLRFAGDSVAGALMGSIFGYGEFPLRRHPLSIFRFCVSMPL